MSINDEKGLSDYEMHGFETDDEATVYGETSRKSTARGRPGIVKKKPMGFATLVGKDIEHTAGYAQKGRVTRMLAHRGNTVRSFVFFGDPTKLMKNLNGASLAGDEFRKRRRSKN